MSAVGLVERYYAAFNAGDIDGMVACLAPDVAHQVNEGCLRVLFGGGWADYAGLDVLQFVRLDGSGLGMSLRFEVSVGEAMLGALDALAALRNEVFREWPYLHDGDLAYERGYLAD